MPVTPLDLLLQAMGAPMPDVATVQAIKALLRGDASSAQQKRAMDYVINELAGAGRNCFTGESPYGTAFRSGAQGVGQAIAMIGAARRVGVEPEA